MADVEVPVKVALGDAGDGGELPGDREANARHGVVPYAALRAEEHREAGEVVVVGMGMKDPRDLADPDADGLEALLDVRTGVDEIGLAAVHDEAPHAGSPDVPAIPFPKVDDREGLPARPAPGELVGRAVARAWGEVEIDLDGLPSVDEFVAIHPEPANEGPVPELDGIGVDDPEIEEILGLPEGAEGELELHAEVLVGGPRAEPRLCELVPGGQPVVAEVDVAALRLDLLAEADDHRAQASVVRVPREDHALAVEHLEGRELAEVAEAAALDGQLGEEDRVRSRLEADPVALDGADDAAPRKEFHDVRRASAEDG